MAPDILFISAASLAGLLIVAAALLKGWQGWLQLKTRELEHDAPDIDGGAGASFARIEMADLKERVRKLEAIASGVDL